jgi:Putative auto-transporter adhesin, head GIN domain
MKIAAIIFCMLLVFSCKKQADRRCYKTSGKIEEKTLLIDDFDTLVIGPKLKVHLIQSTENKIIVKGGKNLLNFFVPEVIKGNTLHIRNRNKCNFLRNDYKSLEVIVYFKHVNYIEYNGSDDLTSDKITQYRLDVLSRQANGTMYLDIETTEFEINAVTNSGDYFVTGNTQNAVVNLNTNSYCDITALNVAGYFRCTNRSQGDALINANGSNLEAYLSTKGNIFYNGMPLNINVTKTGEGKLIKL